MKRKVVPILNSWLGSKGRKPLVLRGARQVGKSTLVRLFAADQGLDLLELNLERHRDMDRVFASLDINLILSNLEAIAGKRVRKPPWPLKLGPKLYLVYLKSLRV